VKLLVNSIDLVNASDYVASGTGYSTAVNRDINLVSIVSLDRPNALHHVF
jgi:hypothetical protein